MIGHDQVLSSARTGQGRDDWQTPDKILDPVRRFAPIGVDVATSRTNPVGAEWFYTEFLGTDERNLADGLSGPWRDIPGADMEGKVAWCQPPYSTAKKWIVKAQFEAGLGAEIIMLIASRTGAKYWAPVFRSDALCFISRRITFIDADTGKPAVDGNGRPMPAPFDSALVYWGHRPGRFRRTFADLGNIVMLRGGR